jgi:hypothetical protein
MLQIPFWVPRLYRENKTPCIMSAQLSGGHRTSSPTPQAAKDKFVRMHNMFIESLLENTSHRDITNLASIRYVQVRNEAHGAFYWYQRPRHGSELRKNWWETTENVLLINVFAVIITLLRVCLIKLTQIFHTLAWRAAIMSNFCPPCRNNPQTFITTSQHFSKYRKHNAQFSGVTSSACMKL